jgi:hypothetical protein
LNDDYHLKYCPFVTQVPGHATMFGHPSTSPAEYPATRPQSATPARAPICSTATATRPSRPPQLAYRFIGVTFHGDHGHATSEVTPAGIHPTAHATRPRRPPQHGTADPPRDPGRSPQQALTDLCFCFVRHESLNENWLLEVASTGTSRSGVESISTRFGGGSAVCLYFRAL